MLTYLFTVLGKKFPTLTFLKKKFPTLSTNNFITLYDITYQKKLAYTEINYLLYL
jgi:hypothetical protein